MIVTKFQLNKKSAKNMRSWLITFNVTLGISVRFDRVFNAQKMVSARAH